MQQAASAAAKPATDAEARLSAYFAGFAAQDDRRYRKYLLRHPVVSARAMRDLVDLPVLEVTTSDSVQGRLLDDALPATGRGPRSLAAALTLPAMPGSFDAGSSKQTLRRKARVAERAGVTWARVDDPVQRRHLLDAADEHERKHPLQQYRKAPPDNPALLQADLWLVAGGTDGRPLVLSVTPVDGPSALLALFRAFEITDESSAARYLMTRVLAEQLVAHGVTHLFDAVHPAHLTNGLRHFQRMVGFRLVRVAKRREG